MSKVASYLKPLLYLGASSYFFVEFPYQVEMIIFFAVLLSIIVLINGIRFGKKEKDSIELGEKYDFRKTILFRFGFPLLLLLFITSIISISDAGWFPEGIQREKELWVIPILILIPSIIEGLMAMYFWEMKKRYYATEEGLLISMNADETYKWHDFVGYRLEETENQIQFKKKNLKYLRIEYDQEYFHQYKTEITSFLDTKLSRV